LLPTELFQLAFLSLDCFLLALQLQELFLGALNL